MVTVANSSSTLQTQSKPTVLLIVCGGIAAYKTIFLARELTAQGFRVPVVLTAAAKKFVTGLSFTAITQETVYDDLFDESSNKNSMAHISLARQVDVICVVPATANFIGRVSLGLADDLATTILMVTDKPVLLAPAMNPSMWQNEAMQENVARLEARKFTILQPEAGEMACGETGVGRLPDWSVLLKEIIKKTPKAKRVSGLKQEPIQLASLAGVRCLVTAGPAQEPIDAVRYVSNYSSGKQGYALAEALALLGAEVILVSGPTELAAPAMVEAIHVKTANEMLEACKASLPADVAILVAAVADWQMHKPYKEKIKKNDNEFQLNMVPTPDILKYLANSKQRPELLIGFAAETGDALKLAKQKLIKKSCDWLFVNKVDAKESPFASSFNHLHRLTKTGSEDWGRDEKKALAIRISNSIASSITKNNSLRKEDDKHTD